MRLVKYQYSNIVFRDNGGFSIYHALKVRLDLVDVGNTGLRLRSNFTWSHAIDTQSDVFSSSPNQVNLAWLDPSILTSTKAIRITTSVHVLRLRRCGTFP